MYEINTAAPIQFGLTNATDGTALTGATVTVYRTIDSGTQTTASGTVTEQGNGQYVFNATSDDMDCTQSVGFLFTASGAIPVQVTIAPDSKLVSQLNDIAAGTQMDLVNAPNATAITAMNSGLATSANITSLQSHGDSNWATATGFALASVWTSGLASTISTNLNATITSRQASGNVTIAGYASGQDPATLLATSFSGLQSHGDSNWATATGFALASVWTSGLASTISTNLNATVSSRMASGNVTVGGYATNQDPATYVLATPAQKLVTDSSGDVTLTSASVSAVQSGLATSSGLSSLQSHGDSNWATATGFALASVWTSGLASTISTNLNATITSRLASGNVTVGGYAVNEDPATLLATSFSNLQSHGDSNWATATGFATAAALSTLSTTIGTDFSSLQSHGDANWATATGFALAGSTPSWYTAPDNTDIATLISSVGSSLGTHVSSILTIVGTSGVVVGGSSITSIQSGLATSAGLSSLQSHGDSNWSTATGFALASNWTSGLATSLGKLTFDGSNNVHSTPQTSVTVGTNDDKSGYSLAATGLDSIAPTEPSGDVGGWTWPQKILALFARAFNKQTFPDNGNGTWTTYQRDGTTTLASQTISDDATTQTLDGA